MKTLIVFLLGLLSINLWATPITSMEKGSVITFFHRVEMNSKVDKVPYYQEGIESEQLLKVDVLGRDLEVLKKGYSFYVGESFMLRVLETDKNGKSLQLSFMNSTGYTLRVCVKSVKGQFLSVDEFKEAFDGVATITSPTSKFE